MAKLTYTFDTYEDQVELRIYWQAPAMHSLIYEWTNHLREITKYPADEMNHTVIAFAEKLYEDWWRMLGEEGLDPWSE